MADEYIARTWLLTALPILGLIAGAAAATTVSAGNSASSHNTGIWKAAVPRAAMQGEFDNLDPIGVAAGARIKADCSINWIDPDTAKRYCFASGTSLLVFLEQPKANIERARRRWRVSNPS